MTATKRKSNPLWDESTKIEETTDDGPFGVTKKAGWKCNCCSLESRNKNQARMLSHLAGDEGLRDKSAGFSGCAVCANSPDDIKEKASL